MFVPLASTPMTDDLDRLMVWTAVVAAWLAIVLIVLDLIR
jgi:hypothetical protein